MLLKLVQLRAKEWGVFYPVGWRHKYCPSTHISYYCTVFSHTDSVIFFEKLLNVVKLCERIGCLLSREMKAHTLSVNLNLLDLGRAPYVLYGVKYIGLVSLETSGPLISNADIAPFGAKSGFEMWFDIGSQHRGFRGQNTPPHAQGCDLSWTTTLL